MYLLILTLFLHPSPPSQWLERAPLVIMLPQLVQGLPLPYGYNDKQITFLKCFHYKTKCIWASSGNQFLHFLINK